MRMRITTTVRSATRYRIQWRRPPGGRRCGGSSRAALARVGRGGRDRLALSCSPPSLVTRSPALDLSKRMLDRARLQGGGAWFGDLIRGRGGRGTARMGPFDAAIERHVAWTLPDPVAAFSALASRLPLPAASSCSKGSWGGEGPLVEVKDGIVGASSTGSGVTRAITTGRIREASVRRLPLAATTTPAPFVDAVLAAGWRAVQLERLLDVEWAAEQREPWPLGRADRRPRYAIVAEA